MGESIRDNIKGRMRRALALTVGGWALFPIMFFAMGAPSKPQFPLALLQFIGIIPFGIGAIWSSRIACPRCAQRIGQSIGFALAVPLAKATPNYCPYCGVNLDEPMPGP